MTVAGARAVRRNTTPWRPDRQSASTAARSVAGGHVPLDRRLRLVGHVQANDLFPIRSLPADRSPLAAFRWLILVARGFRYFNKGWSSSPPSQNRKPLCKRYLHRWFESYPPVFCKRQAGWGECLQGVEVKRLAQRIELAEKTNGSRKKLCFNAQNVPPQRGWRGCEDSATTTASCGAFHAPYTKSTDHFPPKSFSSCSRWIASTRKSMCHAGRPASVPQSRARSAIGEESRKICRARRGDIGPGRGTVGGLVAPGGRTCRRSVMRRSCPFRPGGSRSPMPFATTRS